MSIRRLAWLWVVLLPVLAAAAVPPAPDGGTVTVEATGLAPMPAGRALVDVRRDALRDARRNAVSQACVLLESHERVEGQRLTESLVRAYAAGYVERMDVIGEGPIEGSEPPVYRVRVRATVRPGGRASGPAQVHADPYRPAVVLILTGGSPGRDMTEARATLRDALGGCGVQVREPGTGPALTLHVSAAQGPKRAAGALVVDWQLSAGPQSEGSPSPAGLCVGHWEVDAVGAGEEPWRRVGVLMAEDAVRLWSTPRWTVYRFVRPSRAQAKALARSFSRSARAKVKTAEDRSELSVGLPVAGDPQTVLDAFVRQAGLSDQVELTAASLTVLTCRFRGAPPAAGKRAASPEHKDHYSPERRGQEGADGSAGSGKMRPGAGGPEQ